MLLTNLAAMKVEILSPADYLNSQWAGGQSCQLYITPPSAHYAQCNFDFRLSTAQVEIDHSTFSVLPGVSRKILLLEGQMTLSHKHHHQVRLMPLQGDAFEGDWQTTCDGRGRDFNLMTTGGRQTELSGQKMRKHHCENYLLSPSCKVFFVYTDKGALSLSWEKEEKMTMAKQLVLFHLDKGLALKINAHLHSVCVVGRID